jgi:hypothetical protein
MIDLLYILIVFIFFASCYGLMMAVDKLKE